MQASATLVAQRQDSYPIEFTSRPKNCRRNSARRVISRVRPLCVLSTLLATAACAAEPNGADEIMARVAANQDAAQKARESFVYRQNIEVRLRDTHGHLVREELSEYHVMPGSEKTQKELAKFSGRYLKNGSMVSYAKPGKDKDDGFREEADSDIARNMRDDLTGDRK